MQPVTAISASGCLRRIWWMAWRHFWSLVLVTVQVFTTKTSTAPLLSAISYPAALKRDAKASVSYRLRRQPNVLKEIFLFIFFILFNPSHSNRLCLSTANAHKPLEACILRQTALHNAALGEGVFSCSSVNCWAILP